MSPDNKPNLDPTFRKLTAQQAAAYTIRGGYSPSLYEQIIQYRVSSGNTSFESLLDVGCGTGAVTRDLAIYFKHATGLDPSVEMVRCAARMQGKTKSGDNITYEVVSAEDLENASTVDADSVDLITAGMAAHWFHMETFWPQAARMLKPGGTVALWTRSSLYCHPSTPNAQTVQAVLSHLEDDILGPYELPSNRLSRRMYDDLVLPWHLCPPIADFEKDAFRRIEWNRDGKIEPGETNFMDGSEEVTLAELHKNLDTASMVIRWREANPELAMTEQDCVEVTVRNIVHAMGSPQTDLERNRLKTGSSTALLLFTKRKE